MRLIRIPYGRAPLYSNFFVSTKNGILCVFKSQRTDTSKIYCFEVVGEIPLPFRNDIIRTEGRIL